MPNSKKAHNEKLSASSAWGEKGGPWMWRRSSSSKLTSTKNLMKRSSSCQAHSAQDAVGTSPHRTLLSLDHYLPFQGTRTWLMQCARFLHQQGQPQLALVTCALSWQAIQRNRTFGARLEQRDINGNSGPNFWQPWRPLCLLCLQRAITCHASGQRFSSSGRVGLAENGFELSS